MLSLISVPDGPEITPQHGPRFVAFSGLFLLDITFMGGFEGLDYGVGPAEQSGLREHRFGNAGFVAVDVAYFGPHQVIQADIDHLLDGRFAIIVPQASCCTRA